MAGILFFLFLLVSILHLFACLTDNKRLRIATKPFLMLTLLAFYLAAANPADGFLIAAIVLCFAGDTGLIARSGAMLAVGGAGFLLSHVFFTRSFLPGIRPEAVSVPVFAGAALLYVAVSVAVVRHLMPLVKTKKVAAVLLVYLLFHSATNLSALAQLLTQKTPTCAAVYAGAVLFYVSDCILFHVHFGREQPPAPLKRFLVMFPYVLGIALIVCVPVLKHVK